MVNICVPVLRRYDLLRRLLLSLESSETQPDAVYVIDNGRDAEKIAIATDGFLFPIIVETPEKNLGVAASWNWFLDHVQEERIITNDDIVFAPHSITRMQANDADLVFGVGFSCFLIRDRCAQQIGQFDEAISPDYGYFEDCDYMERAHAAGDARLANAENAGLVHGDGKDGSSTWRAGTPEEIADHGRRYLIAQQNFIRKWGAEPQILEVRRKARISRGNDRKNLLWIGDAGCPSGFALSTHKILDALRHDYNVTVLGLNYRGDPHEYRKTAENPDGYDIYAAAPGGDAFGVGRLIWMCDLVNPDVIVIQQDPWNFPSYFTMLKNATQNYKGEYAKVPVIGIVAVDGKNCGGRWLNDLAHAVFWTQFGADEAVAGGYTGASSVIPLGVDLEVYRPIDRYEARGRRLPKELDDAFIVGNVNRNQPRKRWDLTVRYFAEWAKSRKVPDAYLYLHTAPTGDAGVDVRQLMRHYGVMDRLLLMEPPTFYGLGESEMRDTYNCFDVQISTTQGEGFGLTTLEGMACGVPQIVPEWAALGEWCKDAAWMVPCTSTAIGPPYVNVIGGVADEARFIAALDALYRNKGTRMNNSKAALERASKSQFRWEAIGAEFAKVLDDVLNPKTKFDVTAKNDATLKVIGHGV